MSKFDIQDQELFDMFEARRKREQEEKQRIVDAEYADIVTIEDAAMKRVQVVKLASGVAGRASMGLVFIGAITRGWTEPAFGIACAAVCFLWAWVFARRQGHGNG